MNWILLWALATVPAPGHMVPLPSGSAFWPFAQCGCLCVEGEAKTLCSSVAEAQDNPSLCSIDQTCPAPDPDAEVGPSLDAPFADAKDCAAIQVWDKKIDAYAIVNVCDVVPRDNLPE